MALPPKKHPFKIVNQNNANKSKEFILTHEVSAVNKTMLLGAGRGLGWPKMLMDAAGV